MSAVSGDEGGRGEGFELKEGDVSASGIDGSGKRGVCPGVFVERFPVHFQCGETERAR